MSKGRGVGRQYGNDLSRSTAEDLDVDLTEDDMNGSNKYELFPGDLYRPNAPELLSPALAEQILTTSYLTKCFQKKPTYLSEVGKGPPVDPSSLIEEGDELYSPDELLRVMRGMGLKRKSSEMESSGERMQGFSVLERLERSGSGEDENANGVDGEGEGRAEAKGVEDNDEMEEDGGEWEEDDDYGVDHYASDGDGDDDGGGFQESSF